MNPQDIHLANVYLTIQTINMANEKKILKLQFIFSAELREAARPEPLPEPRQVRRGRQRQRSLQEQGQILGQASV